MSFTQVPFTYKSLKFDLVINNLILKFELPHSFMCLWREEDRTRSWLVFADGVGVSTAKANLKKTMSFLWACDYCSSSFPFSLSKHISRFEHHHFVSPPRIV